MAEWPSVSIIVPVHNAEHALPRLIESLLNQEYPRSRVEILLVDNNSTDGSMEVMRQYTEVIALSERRYQSPGAARNAGIQRATGEILAFIDADCWAHRRWLMAGVRALSSRDLDRVAGHVQFVPSAHPNIYELYDSVFNFQQADFVDRGWCGTGNLFARRELFREVGLFDPVLISQEDREFGLRATRAGKSLGYAPEALVYHETRKSFLALARKWFRTEYGAGQVYRRHGLLELQLWCRKANYRPLLGTWRRFPADTQRSPRLRWSIDLLSNALRLVGNAGNFAGYFGLGGRTDAADVFGGSTRGG